MARASALEAGLRFQTSLSFGLQRHSQPRIFKNGTFLLKIPPIWISCVTRLWLKWPCSHVLPQLAGAGACALKFRPGRTIPEQNPFATNYSPRINLLRCLCRFSPCTLGAQRFNWTFPALPVAITTEPTFSAVGMASAVFLPNFLPLHAAGALGSRE